jgi:hypothetical protein
MDHTPKLVNNRLKPIREFHPTYHPNHSNQLFQGQHLPGKGCQTDGVNTQYFYHLIDYIE